MTSIDNKQIVKYIKQHRGRLQQYTLENIEEIPRSSTEDEDEFRRGSYGKVIDLDRNGTPLVGKVLHAIFFDVGTDVAGMQKQLDKFFNEIELLSKMKHSNIVRFMGIFYRPQGVSPLPVLVMEKMECSLTQYLSTHEKGSIPEDKILNILLDISKGLVYLHKEMKVAHRDLSTNNVLLAVDLSAKIADLGSARVLDRPGGWNSHVILTVQPGTTAFMPPEALEDPPEYTFSIDIFSFGCIIIHLHTHKMPVPIPLPKGKFISEIERRQEYIKDMFDSSLLSMVQQCLAEKNTNRPTSSAIMVTLQAKAKESKLHR